MRDPAVRRDRANEECVTACQTYSQALDGDVAGRDVLAAARHIARCERCQQFAARVAAATTELRRARQRRPWARAIHLKGARS